MVGLLGKKLGQTQVYDAEGTCTPVTVVWVGPNRVLQCKNADRDGYTAVQLGLDDQKEQRVTKPLMGHFKANGGVAVKLVKEFRDFSAEVKPGDTIGADLFSAGEYVDVIGKTKGRGFEGVVKRYNFRGGPASHGAKGWKRRTGALGQRLTPGLVRKGAKMPGHMGQVNRTIQNLLVVQVRPDDQVILIRGAIPGAIGDYVVVRESKKRSKAWVAAKKAQAAAAPTKGKK